jgi:hypothetical protein
VRASAALDEKLDNSRSAPPTDKPRLSAAASLEFFRAKQIYSCGARESFGERVQCLVAAIAAVKRMSGVSGSLMYGGQGVNRYVLEILTIVAGDDACQSVK